MFGVDSFSAVINPPQACIMAVGATRRVPLASAADDDSDVDPAADAGKEGGPCASVFTVQLSFDQRVVHGNDAAAFLERFKEAIEDPSSML